MALMLCVFSRTFAAPLAQVVEQLTLNQRVRGSSPWRCTTLPLTSNRPLLLSVLVHPDV